MNKNYIIIGIALSAVSLVFMGASSGPASTLGEDKTGSPVSTGGCNSCHAGALGSISPSISVLDGGNAVSSYIPGKTYTINASAIGTHNRYGVQLCVLNASNSTAGTLSAGTGTKISALGAKSIGEHTAPRATADFTFSWVAPVDGTGTVTLYSGMVGANNNGSTDGDATGSSTLTLAEDNTSWVTDAKKLDVSVYPNPCVNLLHLVTELTHANFKIYDINGKIHGVGLLVNQTINVENLPVGVYLVQLESGSTLASARFVKS